MNLYNCIKCGKRISKRYYFSYFQVEKLEPTMCKKCKKELDFKNGKRKENVKDLEKIKYRSNTVKQFTFSKKDLTMDTKSI